MPDLLKSHGTALSPLPARISKIADALFPRSLPAAVILALTEDSNQTKESMSSWLRPEELLQLDRFSLEKRRREWLGGRICAKQSLLLHLDLAAPPPLPSPGDCRIENEESGRPHLIFTGKKTFGPVEISISHSKNHATALCACSPCGIDIQHPATNLYKVKERFADSREEEILTASLRSHSPLEQLVMLWSAKEAVKKMLSKNTMPGFHELILHTISGIEEGASIFHLSHHPSGHCYPVVTGLLGNDYGLALCCLEAEYVTAVRQYGE